MYVHSGCDKYAVAKSLSILINREIRVFDTVIFRCEEWLVIKKVDNKLHIFRDGKLIKDVDENIVYLYPSIDDVIETMDIEDPVLLLRDLLIFYERIPYKNMDLRMLFHNWMHCIKTGKIFINGVESDCSIFEQPKKSKTKPKKRRKR